MLEGLEISEVNFSELREYILGSDFNSPRKQTALNKIKSQFKISDYFDLHSDIAKNLSNVLSYDLTHTLGNFLHNIEISENIEGTRKLAQHGDFIISRLRSYLKEFAVVQSKKVKQVFSTEYLVCRPKTDKISSNTLLVFCLTDEIQTILNYSQYGTEHPRFYEFVFKELPLPKALFTLNNKINSIFDEAFKKREQSQSLYRQAKELLLETIGLKNFKPSTKGINIKSFKDSFLATGRLDAEYYQPKYEEIRNILTSYKDGFDFLRKLCSTYRGNFVAECFYTDTNSKYAYIRGADISSNIMMTDKMTYLDERFVKTSERLVQKGDIVIALIGSVGTAALITENSVSLIVSNNLGFVRTNSEKILPEYLHLFLTDKNIGGLLFAQQEMRTAQPKISDKDIHNFPIPLIDNKIQQQIADLIQESFSLRRESEKLLVEAKEMVEREIEK